MAMCSSPDLRLTCSSHFGKWSPMVRSFLPRFATAEMAIVPICDASMCLHKWKTLQFLEIAAFASATPPGFEPGQREPKSPCPVLHRLPQFPDILRKTPTL